MYDENGQELTDPYGYPHYTSFLLAAESRYLYGNITIEGCTFDLDCSEASYKREILSLYGYDYDDSGKKLNVTLKDVTMTGKKVVPIEVDKRYKDGLNLQEDNCTYTVDGSAVNYDGTAKS